MDMNTVTLPKKGLKTRRYSMDMNKDDHIVTLPKKGLKTRPYNIGMEKMDLKTRPYSIDMEKKGLINIKNEDDECFRWCHIRHLSPQEKILRELRKRTRR